MSKLIICTVNVITPLEGEIEQTRSILGVENDAGAGEGKDRGVENK